MSNYSQVTAFTPKDSLSTGNPAKVIKGSDFDAEFAAISTAIISKADDVTVTASLETKVAGPVSSTDNSLPRFDGTTGKLLQGSTWTLEDDAGLKTRQSNGVGNFTNYVVKLEDFKVKNQVTLTGFSIFSGYSWEYAGVEKFGISALGIFSADLSNTTLASRSMWQTNVTDGRTRFGIIPNGTGPGAGFDAYNSSDPTNASVAEFTVSETLVTLGSSASGSGSTLPLAVNVGGVERQRFETNGNVLTTSGVLGYGAGAGGSVTQITSKSTTVVLNKPCGRITTHNAALAAGASVTFDCTNSFATLNDLILCNSAAGSSYNIETNFVTTGSFRLRVTNITGGSLSDAISINFAIIKGTQS